MTATGSAERHGMEDGEVDLESCTFTTRRLLVGE